MTLRNSKKAKMFERVRVDEFGSLITNPNSAFLEASFQILADGRLFGLLLHAAICCMYQFFVTLNVCLLLFQSGVTKVFFRQVTCDDATHL